MATTSSSVTSAGTYLANGSFDEISTTASTNGLVGYWNSSIGYYGTGNVWSDLTNNNNNFTLGTVTSYSNNSIVFYDNVNSFAYNTIPQIANASFVTVEIIVNSPITGGMLFGFGAYDIYTNGSNLGFNTGQSNIYGLTAAQVTALGIRNTLTHYVFVMVGLGGNIPASNQIWINGVQQVLANVTGTTTTNSRGFNYYGDPNIVLNGWAVPDTGYSQYKNDITYKSIRIYNRALSTAEIQQNYNVIAASIGKSPLATPPTMTVYPTTITVSGSYDEVTYNPTNVNLLSYSQELDNTAWGKNAVTILPNTIIAPDGTLTADKIQETAVTNFFAVVQNPTALPSKSYTISFYAKAGERTQVVVSFTVSNAYVMYNLATGTVTTTSGAYLVGSSITFVGNGWYRCTASLTSAPSGSNLLYFIIALANSSSDTYAGTAGYGAYVWGTQLEQNIIPTTYQVTPPTSTPPNLYNLLTYSQDLSNVVWDKSASGTGTIPVVTPNFALAPDGTLTASKVDYASGGNGQSTVGNGGISNPTVGTTRTFSVWMRTLTGTTGVTLYNGDEVTSVSVTTDWQRFSYTRTTVGTNAYGVRLSKREIWGTGGTASVLIWGAQWEVGSLASIYQGVSAQNTLITGFAKRDTQAGITYVTDKFDELTKILPVTSGLILNLDSTRYNGGTTWQNQTVNNYNATLINNPAYNTENGGIIKFNTNIYTSTPQYVTTTIPSNTFTPSSNWTMSTWVRFNASNTSIAYLNPRPDGLGFYGTSGNLLGCVWFGNYGLFWTTNVFNNVRGFYVGSQVRTGSPYSESNIQTSNLTFGVWYNVTGVYDYTGNSHKLYINGALVNTAGAVTTGTFQNLATIPYIVSGTDGIYGGSSGGKVLDGDLGQNLIYNRALTAQEVLDNYNALKGRYGY